MPVSGKLEVTIKINRLPTEVTTDKNGWKEFDVECGKRHARVSLRPRMWNKLEQASTTYPHWVAVITGVMGDDVQRATFKLLEPNMQVFEYTPKPAPSETPADVNPAKPAEPSGETST